jgi:anti-anti-sigma factor
MVKVRLAVVTRGKWEGKRIPIVRSPFLIGRDPACHLRPASSLVSNQHCALTLRDGKVFVRDLGSTNGTFLNDKPVRGEQELQQGDALRIGPLDFDIEVEVTAGVDKATPFPPTKTAGQPKDAAAAAVLLSLPGPQGRAGGGTAAEQEEVPGGRTEMDMQIRYPIEWEEIGGAVVVHFNARMILEDETIRMIGQQLLRLVEECHQRKVLLNLRNVRAMSSAMIQKLVAFSQKVQGIGGQLVLCSIQPQVFPVFQQFKLARGLVIRNDEQEGLQALR